MSKKTPVYHYYISEGCAYRINIKKAKQPPEVFYENGWRFSFSFPDREKFTCNIDCGVVRKASLIEACTYVNALPVLFAPTQSSRIYSK